MERRSSSCREYRPGDHAASKDTSRDFPVGHMPQCCISFLYFAVKNASMYVQKIVLELTVLFHVMIKFNNIASIRNEQRFRRGIN